MTGKLTKAAEKRITDDWKTEIPTLGIYRPRHLLRRVDALLVGICLDRDSGGEIYKPTFHVHCLCREFPCVSLGLDTQIRSDRSGGPDYVEVKWHEQKYKEYAARMVRQSLLPLGGDLHICEITQAYRRYMKTPLGRDRAAMLFRDLITLNAFGGRQEDASRLLTECLRLPDWAGFQHLGGRAELEAKCKQAIEDLSLIRKTVQEQIVHLGVDELPEARILY